MGNRMSSLRACCLAWCVCVLGAALAMPAHAQPQPGYPMLHTGPAPEQTLQEMAAASLAVMPSVTLTVRQNSKEMVLDYGPVDLPAAMHNMPGMDMAMLDLPPRWITVPNDAWLHGYWVEVVDGNGAKVPMSTLHHVNVIATQQRELFSPIMLRIAAASSETEPVTLPRFLGLDAHKGDTLLVRTMLHNPTGKSYERVHIRVHFPLTERNSTFGSLRIQPFYLDVTPPAAPHDFDVPPGHSERYWDAKPAIDVRIVGFSGHVHKYATMIRLEDRTDNTVIWQARPDTTAAGEPKALPLKRFLATFGKPISAGHVYRLTVTYDNPTGQKIIDGGMGTLGGVVLVAGGTRWPSVDLRDPEYRMDVRAMWRP